MAGAVSTGHHRGSVNTMSKSSPSLVTTRRKSPPSRTRAWFSRLPRQLLQSRDYGVGSVVGREGRGEAALRIHHIDQRAVVHVIAAVGTRVLSVVNLVVLRRLRDLVRRTG